MTQEMFKKLVSVPQAYPSHRDALLCTGTDAEQFLQGQISQDVSALSDGESSWSFLLNPDGKISCWFRINRITTEKYLLDMDAGWGQRALDRLVRFKLRVQCEIELVDLPMISIRGDGANKLKEESHKAEIVADAEWPRLEGFDLLGDSIQMPAKCNEGKSEEYKFLRIWSGIPCMGSELDEKIIPAETNLVDRSVSFTKGCYTGQELVARVDSRGNNVPKHMRRISSAGVFDVGSEIEIDGKTIGKITSALRSDNETIGLGFISRSFEPPGEAKTDGITVSIESVS